MSTERTDIEVVDLVKRFGGVTAVDHLSFTARPGRVTGFLGPNGSGKSTTLRALLGLISPTQGAALIGGRPFRELADPVATVGAVLEPSFHPARTARAHLQAMAASAGLARARVEQVLEEVDIARAAHRPVGGFSLGMRQRLGLAGALLGDPQVLVLDEPANGLDPDGVHWLRDLLRGYGREGRTVIVSSHLLSEVSLTVDRVLAIDKGRLVLDDDLDAITARLQHGSAVRTPDTGPLLIALAAAGLEASVIGPDGVLVPHATPEQVGQAVAAAGVVVHELRRIEGTLEDAFLALTQEASR
jgi:ABC-2 type transport system ATP-binding protein